MHLVKSLMFLRVAWETYMMPNVYLNSQCLTEFSYICFMFYTKETLLTRKQSCLFSFSFFPSFFFRVSNSCHLLNVCCMPNINCIGCSPYILLLTPHSNSVRPRGLSLKMLRLINGRIRVKALLSDFKASTLFITLYCIINSDLSP